MKIQRKYKKVVELSDSFEESSKVIIIFVLVLSYGFLMGIVKFWGGLLFNLIIWDVVWFMNYILDRPKIYYVKEEK